MGMITLSHYPYILCHFGIYVPDMVPKTFQACHLCTFNVATIFGEPSLHLVYYRMP